jgi:hypothetical protein
VIALAAIGLTPISPVTLVAPVVEMPVLLNTVKLPAVPKLIAEGPEARAVTVNPKLIIKEKAVANPKNLLIFFIY